VVELQPGRRAVGIEEHISANLGDTTPPTAYSSCSDSQHGEGDRQEVIFKIDV
jgi:hypothetical protein